MKCKQVVAACLKELNAKDGMTQQKLAECGSISVKYCHNLEYAKSNPSFAVMARFHKNCGIDLNQLAELITEEE